MEAWDREMSTFERSYHLLFSSWEGPGLVMLKPDRETAKRVYLGYPLPPGKPLRFSNGFSDRLSDPSQERIDDMLSEANSFGVREHVRALVERFDIEGLQFYPMIFTDSRGREHTDYWYMNLYNERSFLDLGASQVRPDVQEEDDEEDDEDDDEEDVGGDDDEDDNDVMVVKYAFDAKAMADVPEESRLIFQLKGVLNPNFFIHDRILELLNQAKVTGYRAFRVSDFTEGMQFF
jgi:hypothetical protein